MNKMKTNCEKYSPDHILINNNKIAMPIYIQS